LIQGTATFSGGEDGVFAPWRDEEVSHLALAHRIGNSIAVCVRILKAYNAMIIVSDNTSDYAAFARSGPYGFFVANDAVRGAVRHSRLAEEYARLGGYE
jgi:hypothetical protein